MLNLSNIQHFSVGDGDGIRTTVFLKGCNLRCPWCHNPENLSAAPVLLKYPNGKDPECVGRMVTCEEILPELLEDFDFYRESGGGVTLSGGEAMLQASELRPLVKQLREKGVSVLMDTAGCVPYSSFELLNADLSGYLFDFKTADADRYRAIGGDLAQVTENLKRLLSSGVGVTVRIPLIPQFNTAESEIRAICRALSALGVTHVELLPFHRLGSGKYAAMGMVYAYKDQPPLSKEELHTIENLYKQYFSVKTE